MKIITPLDNNFNYKDCEKLYNKYSKFMNNQCNFEDIVKNSHFFSFYENEKLLGCIYVTFEENKLFLSGFSVRKNHSNNIWAINLISKFYVCPLWAKTKNLTAIIALKKCGFTFQFSKSDIKYFKKEN